MALSHFLFVMVVDRLTDEVRQESPYIMTFTEHTVICSESREQVEESLERWRHALERRGIKVSGSKTEYMCVDEREMGVTIKLEGVVIVKIDEFKYLESPIQSNRQCIREVKKRMAERGRKWFGHVQRRNRGYIEQRTLKRNW